jgi:iron complex outermembrane recepter protein
MTMFNHRRPRGLSLSLLLAAGSAQAQTAQTDTLPDITVTALRHTQTAQQAPATVSVVSGSEIVQRGITDLRGLADLAPALRLDAENTATQVFVRGIGQSSDGDSNSPAVAVNIDGVYTPRYATGTALFDVAQVEVLPGPQGTLYGRNAAGGAINITSRTPGDRLAANGFVELGNYDLVHASLGVDLPVTATLALRAAVDRQSHDGYLSDGQDDADSIAGRLTLAWHPGPDLSVLLRGEISHQGGNGAGIVAYPYINPANPWYEPTTPGDDFHNREVVRKASAEITWRAPGVTVTYIPAFTYYDFGYRTPLSVPVLAPALAPLAAAPYGGTLADGQPGGYFAAALVVPSDAQRQYSNELRLASANAGDKAADAVTWLAGLYQLAGQVDIDPGDGVDIYNTAAATGGATTPYTAVTWGGANQERHRNESYAAYGQVTYAVTGHWRASAGARYSLDRQHAFGVSQTYLPATSIYAVPYSGGALVDYNGTVATPATSYNLRESDHHFDWKLGAEFDASDSSLIYASVQTGYNQGGFNLALDNTFLPEHLLAFTLGTKNTLLHKRLVLNDEAFFYNYDNLQVSSFDATKGSGFRVNVPRSVIYGNQVDLRYRAARNTTLNASLVWMGAHIVRGTLAEAAVYGGTSQYPACGAPIAAALCSGAAVDFSGYGLDHAPPLSAVVSLRQGLDLRGGSRLEALVATHADAATWGIYAHLPNTRTPAYTTTDLTLTWHAPGDRWTIAGWVRNLENTARLEAQATDSIYGQAPGLLAPPRTYGVRLGFDWGA